MHKVIKYFYHDGKKVKRLDKSLHVLLKFVRDKSIDMLIKNIKGKYTQHNIGIIKRHHIAVNGDLSLEKVDDKNIWIVNSTYCIENISTEVCCNLKCEKCNICFHMYTCTCNDYVISSSICKHIHFVVIQTFPKIVTAEDVQPPIIASKTKTADLTKAKQNVYVKISQFFFKFQSASIEHIGEAALSQIESHIDTIDKLLELKTCDQEFSSTSHHKEPHNKKIEKQKNFYSTKKKKYKNISIKKPNVIESAEIETNLKHKSSDFISCTVTNDHNYYIKQ